MEHLMNFTSAAKALDNSQCDISETQIVMLSPNLSFPSKPYMLTLQRLFIFLKWRPESITVFCQNFSQFALCLLLQPHLTETNPCSLLQRNAEMNLPYYGFILVLSWAVILLVYVITCLVSLSRTIRYHSAWLKFFFFWWTNDPNKKEDKVFLKKLIFTQGICQ